MTTTSGLQASDRTLASYSAFDPDVQNDPWQYYGLLRKEAPVYKDPATGIVMVSTHDLVTEVLKSWQVFSNRFARAMGGEALVKELRDENGEPLEEGFERGWMPVDTMLTADPPEQKRFRSLVDKAFSLKRVRALEPRIREICDGLIDDFIDHGRVELRDALAVPLPLTVIAEQLGVAGGDIAQFKCWSDGFVKQLGGMATPEEQTESARLILAFQRYFAEIVACRRESPQDDIISAMVNAEVEGEAPLNLPESLSILQQLLVAGNETTANAILEGMRLFAEHPDQYRKIQADPSLIPNAVEEVLRHATPTSNMWRVVTEDTVLGGVELAKGQMVMIRYASANRDELVFSEPDRFDVERENASHQIAFGLGTHYCLGAQLAKAEMRNAFALLSSRLATLRLASDAPPLWHPPNILLRGLESLALEFERA